MPSLIDQIRDGLDRGDRVAQIAEQTGFSKGKIYRTISDAPDLSLPVRQPTLHERLGARMGHPKRALEAQDDEFIRWLSEQIPEGSTISEALVACALDVFNAETEDEP